MRGRGLYWRGLASQGRGSLIGWQSRRGRVLSEFDSCNTKVLEMGNLQCNQNYFRLTETGLSCLGELRLKFVQLL